MAESENAVVKACEKHWDKHKSNCSGFVSAVARELSLILIPPANSMVKTITSGGPWIVLPNGSRAASAADDGRFVVAGLKDDPHGHVVVVVPGTPNRGLYPYAYWGSLGKVGKKNETINWSWSKEDRDKVVYSAYNWNYFASSILV